MTLWTQDKREVLRWYREYKHKQKCECCGVRASDGAVLQFHHIEPTSKRWNISQMVIKGFSVARIKQEANKCMILCEKCHKRIHREGKE